MRSITVSLFICLSAGMQAQKLAHHDILVVDMSASEGKWKSGQASFLTSFNPEGYNNQPKFFSENELWLTVQKPDDTTQTDIYILNLAGKTVAAATRTRRTAEYSPTLMPGGDRFSAVRVEEDGNQRLWSFPVSAEDNGRPEFETIYDVGYHCWINDTSAALFIVGHEQEPHQLVTAGTEEQKPRRIASKPGRCLLMKKDGQLAFVQKITDQIWYLKQWSPVTDKQEIIVKMPSGSEDFAILPDGSFLTAQGSILYTYSPGRDTEWKEAGNLGLYGVKKITRVAVSPGGKTAVVVE
jgi:hypothetical protein